jgi:hypothetical protein
MAFRRLIEPMELRLSTLGRREFSWRNHANHFARRHPIYIIPGTDMVFFRNLPRHRDLVFGCDLSHLFPANAYPYPTKDQILTPANNCPPLLDNLHIGRYM